MKINVLKENFILNKILVQTDDIYRFLKMILGNDQGNNFGQGRGLMSALAGAGVYEGTTVLYVRLKRLDAQYIPIKSYLKTQHFSVIL